MTKRQLKERVKLLRAMETIARCVNDEDVFELWIIHGIPDGEIKENTTDEDLEWLAEDEDSMLDIMDTFVKLMKNAYRSGGLCLFDGEVSLMTK